MVSEAVEKKLYDVASKGDVTTLVQLIEEDPYLVHVVSFPCSRNLLHVAAMHGQTAIVEEVLKFNPRLARISDSQKSSPLHIAVEEGHVEICQRLLSVAPQACLWRDSHDMNPLHIATMKGHFEICQRLLSVAPEVCWWRDCHDMNPLHIAAMKGHVEIMEHLLEESHLLAMERLRRKETVLHLCVKHGQLSALKVLIDRLGKELVNAIDEDGETILHLAVRSNQFETIQYLVKSKKIMRRTHNSTRRTPLIILRESPQCRGIRYSAIYRLLLSMLPPPLNDFFPEVINTIMVVVILIATMAFQSSINPPGGIWQEDTSSHKAGDAVIAHTHPHIYKSLVCANTIAFVSSILTILLITSGGPSQVVLFRIAAAWAMLVSIIAITFSYGAATMVTSPNAKNNSVDLITITLIILWLIAFLVIFIFHYLARGYFNWEAKIRSHEDLTTDPLYKRILYWIFQRMTTHEDV